MADSHEQVKNLFQSFLGDKRLEPRAVELPAKSPASIKTVPEPVVPAVPVAPAPVESRAESMFEPIRPAAPRAPTVMEEEMERLTATEPEREESLPEPVAWQDEELVKPKWLDKVRIVPEFEFDPASAVDVGTQVAEEVRTLRTNLWSIRIKENRKVIALTSCRHNEGKTTLGMNLARFMGKNRNRRILLIDCDLRRPKLKDLILVKPTNGFDDVLEGRCELWEAMVYSEKDNLYFVPSVRGHSNASEMLEQRAFENIVKELRKGFDYIIFDSPPILSTTDPLILGRRVDGMILVVKANETQRESVEHARAMLEQVKVHVMGVVLTQMRSYLPRYLYRYQYYHDYYQYYYQNDQRRRS